MEPIEINTTSEETRRKTRPKTENANDKEREGIQLNFHFRL